LNLLSPSSITELLRKHGLRPQKRFGQNFLVDGNILGKICAAARDSRFCLEVGPGLGTVTMGLAGQAEKVVAVEADRRLIPVLQEILAGLSSVEVVEADFLHLDLGAFLGERFGDERIVAVSNLPYYITSPIIVRLLENKARFRKIVLMMQREVSDRLLAGPSTADYSSLSVFVQYHCAVKVISRVSRNVFYPPPEVDSALVALEPLPEPPVRTDDEGLFFRVVRAAFGMRRKTLWNALVSAAGEDWSKDCIRSALEQSGIDPGRRGETLSLSEFAALTNTMRTCGIG
jgi:16S rRNA (adenine1518-N6/adenine1519-N6)-dimethyltransferase